MKYHIWNNHEGPPSLRNGLTIEVSHKEALSLIQSMANQMVANEPNTGRHEFRMDDEKEIGKTRYFTIFVTMEIKE